MARWRRATACSRAVESAKLRNLVVVTGDIHQNWAGELKKNFADEKSATLGVEFVATSISSLGDGFDINDDFKALLQQQPAHEVLQQPARLRSPRRHARALAGGLPGARQGERAATAGCRRARASSSKTARARSPTRSSASLVATAQASITIFGAAARHRP